MSSAQSALNAVDASERPRHSEQPQQEQTNRRHPKVILREASNIVTGPVPPDFLFLESPSPPQSYRIRFRHPAYPDSSNVLLSLHAWDRAGGGIHYGLAHTACAIIANNRFDGYLSIARDGSSSIETEWDACLPTDSHGYYFHVPPPPEPKNQEHAQNPPPYRWPFVPSFLDWKFPHILPDAWQKCAKAQVDSMNTAQSDQAGAVQQRDIVCRVSAHSTSTEVAHLIPAHESTWFKANCMWEYNNNTTLDATNLLRDPNNALLLRADLHKAFDDRKFSLFPKDDQGFVVHVLQSAPDLRLLYHNARVTIPQCEVNYVFARFAWSILPSLTGFLTSTQKSRLVVRWDEVSEDWIESEVSALSLAQRSVASRSNSPTKRSRIASSTDEHIDENCAGEVRGRKRNIDVGPAYDGITRQVKNRRLSLGKVSLLSTSLGESTAPSMTEDGSTNWEVEASSAAQSVQAGLIPNNSSDLLLVRHDSHDLQESIETDGLEHGCDILASTLDSFCREALTRQRPSDYYQPPYEKHRDAREELELMGVEIIDNGFIDEDNDFI